MATGMFLTPFGASAAPPAVDLGTATSYSVLGGQTVTNTGPTTLEGDLGVSPGDAITGFPPGIVGGAQHAGNAEAAQAQSDLVIAYDDAAGRAPTASVDGDLVGQTLTAGVYNSTGPLELSGMLTLDGQGDPDSAFIFQVASTLITASSSEVVLTNGAQACNVFWQVGSSATLGTASDFKGTIMALTSITVDTGTVVEGRALARNAQVSLDTNVFTMPGCDTDGTEIEGTEVEGTEVDGTEVDGTEVDGTEVDGTEVDGTEVDGVEVDGAEVEVEGVEVDGAEVEVEGVEVEVDGAEVEVEGVEVDGAEVEVEGVEVEVEGVEVEVDGAEVEVEGVEVEGTEVEGAEVGGTDGVRQPGVSALAQSGVSSAVGRVLGLSALLILAGVILVRRWWAR
ncbi:ice-binding family protein [Isoptericola croceus]|uniref:ice-binding family protein n=1 Tax=Isoptericola croceus TaxID=3031406 RepID=UPI0023F6DDE9|nr:ice-binding family protein [Isoptericola croceus]